MGKVIAWFIATGSTDSLDQVQKVLVDSDIYVEFHDKVVAELIRRYKFRLSLSDDDYGVVTWVK